MKIKFYQPITITVYHNALRCRITCVCFSKICISAGSTFWINIGDRAAWKNFKNKMTEKRATKKSTSGVKILEGECLTVQRLSAEVSWKPRNTQEVT